MQIDESSRISQWSLLAATTEFMNFWDRFSWLATLVGVLRAPQKLSTTCLHRHGKTSSLKLERTSIVERKAKAVKARTYGGPTFRPKRHFENDSTGLKNTTFVESLPEPSGATWDAWPVWALST
jgi:hypothetical protein